jgi:hypothetical protein
MIPNIVVRLHTRAPWGRRLARFDRHLRELNEEREPAGSERSEGAGGDCAQALARGAGLVPANSRSAPSWLPHRAEIEIERVAPKRLR